MSRIGAEIKEIISKKNNIVYVGTISESGEPNISPRAVIEVGDDYLLWGDSFQNKTYHNLSRNTRATVAVADEAAYQGFQLKGTVQSFTQGEVYDRVAAVFQQAGFGTPKQAVKFLVSQVYSLVPSPDSARAIG